MGTQAKKLTDWLNTLPADSIIGVDGEGLGLQVLGRPGYCDVGALPLGHPDDEVATAPTEHVVVVGNPIDGVVMYGPFPSAEDAVDYCDRASNLGGDYWIAPLRAPEAR